MVINEPLFWAILIIVYFIGVYVGRKISFGKALNEHQLAIDVASLEGKKKSLSIAQIKEVIARTFEVLSMYSKDEIYKTIEKHIT